MARDGHSGAVAELQTGGGSLGGHAGGEALVLLREVESGCGRQLVVGIVGSSGATLGRPRVEEPAPVARRDRRVFLEPGRKPPLLGRFLLMSVEIRSVDRDSMLTTRALTAELVVRSRGDRPVVTQSLAVVAGEVVRCRGYHAGRRWIAGGPSVPYVGLSPPPL